MHTSSATARTREVGLSKNHEKWVWLRKSALTYHKRGLAANQVGSSGFASATSSHDRATGFSSVGVGVREATRCEG